jgi:hypothetical protein
MPLILFFYSPPKYQITEVSAELAQFLLGSFGIAEFEEKEVG